MKREKQSFNETENHLGQTLPRIFHVVPVLCVPYKMTQKTSPHHDGLRCDEVQFKVKWSLPTPIEPEGGIHIRCPYPEDHFFACGSADQINGWSVALPDDVTSFDIEFSWRIESAAIWNVAPRDDWWVDHRIHVTLKPGNGNTFSMDSLCGDGTKVEDIWRFPFSLTRLDDETPLQIENRTIELHTDMVWGKRYRGQKLGKYYLIGPCRPNQQLKGSYMEETLSLAGIPHADVLTINSNADDPMAWRKQTASFSNHNDAHRANALIEMPAEIFAKAIELAETIPFHQGSEFSNSVSGIPGGLESHPAMTLLCDWWETVRPAGEPFKAGSAFPLIRTHDDGVYWCGSFPNINDPVDDYNPGGKDMARVGDFMVIQFIAKQRHAVFDERRMNFFLPSGAEGGWVEASENSYLSGKIDEAHVCLAALANFREQFFAAAKALGMSIEPTRESLVF